LSFADPHTEQQYLHEITGKSVMEDTALIPEKMLSFWISQQNSRVPRRSLPVERAEICVTTLSTGQRDTLAGELVRRHSATLHRLLRSCRHTDLPAQPDGEMVVRVPYFKEISRIVRLKPSTK
jgi:hypothetical protein